MPKGIAKSGKRKSSIRVSHVIITCEVCGKQRDYMPGELRVRGKIRFCSRECMGRAAMTGTIKICLQCSKEFYSAKARTKEKFCSKKCSSKYRKGKKLSSEDIEKVKNGMAKLEVVEKLKLLNSRKRSPQTEEHKMNRLKSRGDWTDEQKSRVSNKMCGHFPSNMIHSTPYSNCKHGYYDINGKRIFFRSRWEANYALYLDFLVKQKVIDKWEYEEDVFIFNEIKFGTRSYRPDFKVYVGDKIEYHEIKGYMNPQSMTKLKRMAKYYPEVKIVLIDKNSYLSIYRQLKKLLSFY